MSDAPSRSDERTGSQLSRLLVGLYPPAWRQRYAAEFSALLDDTGVGLREALDVIRAAVAAWLRPSARLHDRAARLRTTATVTLYAWTAAAVGAVLFAKVTHDGALSAQVGAGAAPAFLYDTFALTAGGSALTMAAGGLPLAAGIVWRTGNMSRRRIAALLAVPLVAVACFLGVALAVARLASNSSHPGIGFGWFVLLVGLGLTTAGVCVAGPALAVERARPAGPALTWAVLTGAGAAALMIVATAASLAAEFVQQADPRVEIAVVVYGTAMTSASAIAATSCIRGLRAALPSTSRGAGNA